MLIGQVLLKRYRVIEEIGSGAFGNTYIAIDTAFPGEPRRVVKHLCPKNNDSESLAIAERLFKSEATVLSRLGEHDRIPRLFAYFKEDGEFFLVQELIEGQDLTREFQPGKKWSETATVKFLQELLEILAFVHQNNTIHRDLKPANIMRRNSDGKLVLIDFGAVKEVLTVDKANTTVAIGSFPYMPPEQGVCKPGKYSDIYAVGMLGIQALTGLPSRELPQDADRFKQILAEKQIKISPQLEYVLSKMISFQPENRFDDGLKALQALTETKIVQPQSKSKLLLILLGLIGLTGAGFFGLTFVDQPNYNQLETYLQNKQWQQADAETDKLILKIAGENSALDAESSNKIPCESLQTIDRLWTKNSNERFGFTPQKEAFLETGNEFDEYIESSYEEFGNKVNWRIFGTWKRYEDFNFQAIDPTITPSGYLPSPGKVTDNRKNLRWQEREMLLGRFNACGL